MSKLTITTVQAELNWEDVVHNLSVFDTLLQSANVHSDLIVLPEMFSTAYTMRPSHVAHHAEHTINWMAQQAQQHNAVVTGSIVVEENKQFYNRLIWMPPSGEFAYYDKKHLFGMAGEDKVYAPGKERKIFTCKGWKVLPLICYDLRFPVWSRYNNDYDLILYVASWPVNRIQAWSTLIQARAIENQSYTIGVNRVGEDENGYKYSGNSMVVDYSGHTVYMASNTVQCASTIIDKTKQDTFRAKLPFLQDRDDFDLK